MRIAAAWVEAARDRTFDPQSLLGLRFMRVVAIDSPAIRRRYAFDLPWNASVLGSTRVARSKSQSSQSLGVPQNRAAGGGRVARFLKVWVSTRSDDEAAFEKYARK
jgi:hypothetical protein